MSCCDVGVTAADDTLRRMKLVVLGDERQVAPALLAPSGCLGLMPIAPPIDFGGRFRCMPRTGVAHWSGDVPDIDKAPPFRRVEVPDVSAVPELNGGGRRVENVQVWEPGGRPQTMILQLVDDKGIFVLAAYFVGAEFHFVERQRQVVLDCAWAAGLEGVAFCRWDPQRISITYNVTLESGRHESRGVTSDPTN